MVALASIESRKTVSSASAEGFRAANRSKIASVSGIFFFWLGLAYFRGAVSHQVESCSNGLLAGKIFILVSSDNQLIAVEKFLESFNFLKFPYHVVLYSC